MVRISRNGTSAYIGIPAREAAKLEELWMRDELGVELSVDVHASVVVGVFPMRIARYTFDPSAVNGNGGHAPARTGLGQAPAADDLIEDQPH